MALQTLRLVNFRSYTDRSFEFSPGITFITGPNGSGKTNIIEALYLLSMTRSWRGQNRDLVHHTQRFFRIEARYGKQALSMTWDGRANFLLNGNAQKPHQVIGTLPVVLFEPGSLALAAGAPSARRQFMDATLAQIDPHYLRSLLRYQRALRQRNRLLRHPSSDSELFAWDMILTQTAGSLVEARLRMVAILVERITALYQAIAKSQQVISLSYRSTVDTGAYGEAMIAGLQTALERDRRYGFTSIGPHRDDLVMGYNKRPLQQRASQGELRTVVLALKLLQLDYLKSHTIKPPLLLLDDVFSELDSQRQRQLLHYIKDTQTILSTTEPPAGFKAHEIQLP